jgi:hypothetical protein
LDHCKHVYSDLGCRTDYHHRSGISHSSRARDLASLDIFRYRHFGRRIGGWR